MLTEQRARRWNDRPLGEVLNTCQKGTQASIEITERALLQLEALDAGKRREASYIRLKAEDYGHLAELYGGPISTRTKLRPTDIRITRTR